MLNWPLIITEYTNNLFQMFGILHLCQMFGKYLGVKNLANVFSKYLSTFEKNIYKMFAKC